MISLVTLTAIFAGLTSAAPHSQDRSSVGLNALARGQGKQWFGSAADIPGTAETTDAAYLKILKHEFGELTPANALKVIYLGQSFELFPFTDPQRFLQ
jgi:endo-1,4-beta-xylanase